MTIEDQLTAIRAPGFLNDLKAKSQTVLGALESAGVTIDGTVTFTVNDVPIRVGVGDDNATIGAGQDDNGQPLYTWGMPVGWVS